MGKKLYVGNLGTDADKHLDAAAKLTDGGQLKMCQQEIAKLRG